MTKFVFAVLVLLATPAFAIDKCRSGSQSTCIVDGDTFRFKGEKIRMRGYDTPEPFSNICGGAAEKRLAARASARVIQLFNTSRVEIVRVGKDKYNRTLADV